MLPIVKVSQWLCMSTTRRGSVAVADRFFAPSGFDVGFDVVVFGGVVFRVVVFRALWRGTLNTSVSFH